jgi:hypothetical protein
MRATLALLVMLLAACAGQDWVRPDRTAEENARDRALCETLADQQYRGAYAAERSQAYEGGLTPQDTPLAGIPRRYGRGDLVESDDASRRLDRDLLRMRTNAARGEALDRCMEDSGFRLGTPAG